MNWNDDVAAEIRKVARARKRPTPQQLREQFGPLFKDLQKTMRFHHLKMIRDLLNVCAYLPKKAAGVEIGSFAGESALLFLLSGKVGHLACVDPWQADYYRNNQVPRAEAVFDQLQAQVPGLITKHKMTGLEFLRNRKHVNGLFDFMYLDGCHGYETVKAEIAAGLPMIVDGGFIAGHDYGYRKSPGVARAVKEVCGYADVLFGGYSWLVWVDRLRNKDDGSTRPPMH